MSHLKQGDKVHYKPTPQFAKRGWREWDGTIVKDLSYLGDGKRNIWGIAMPHWTNGASLAVDESEITLI